MVSASESAAATASSPPGAIGSDLSRRAGEAVASASFDARALAADLNARAAGDPVTLRTLTTQVEAQLSPVERGELARALDAANDNALAVAASPGPDPVQLGLDLGQMALDITGLFDPTPISDGANAVVSAGRAIGSLFSGDFGDAGGHALNGVISGVAIVPALGDAAKLGKIGKWADTINDAVGAVARNPALRATLEPGLRAVKDAVDAIPQSAIDALPAGARDAIGNMKRQLDDFFAPRAAANAATATNLTARVGANSVQWTVDANGYPTRVTATLSELQPSGTPRGNAELDAQDVTRARGLSDDDAGHVIGHRFLGDQGTRNMFPQNFNFNRSAYKTLENEWAGWIRNGGTVRVEVELIGGTGGRPDQVGATYEVFNDAGRRVFDNQELFDNAAGQQFQRVPNADMSRILNQ
ncbi:MULTISPECIES: DNA/RNA non-specific endonuclease [unclassified Sphingomonas]|uniref:DNA/RNA non-specific endonuclease n=1 Tax=unclassified Sphingomonas TaxID=196159 RepID=UPI000832627B|nr:MULTISPECIES: DNA/RNA non-specific endonuclease [unclassified Sphingomonas]